MNAKVVPAGGYKLLDGAEQATEYVMKAAGRLERTTLEAGAPTLPDLLQAVFRRFKWPAGLQTEWLTACQQLNALEAAYLAFLKLPTPAERRAAMIIFAADHEKFVQQLDKLTKSASALAKEERQVLTNSIKAFNEHVNMRRGPIEALGRNIAGAGHVAPETIAKKAVQGVAEVGPDLPKILQRLEKALSTVTERARYPHFSAWVNAAGGLDGEALKKAIDMVLKRLEQSDGKALLKKKADELRRILSEKFQGLQRNVQGKLGEEIALTQEVTQALRERSLKKALSEEYGLLNAGWQKISVDKGVTVTKLNGKDAGELFDASNWMYRLDAPPRGVNADIDALADIHQSIDPLSQIDGIAFSTFALESKAGDVGELMKQFNKTGARSVFGVVELPIPGRSSPGRFLIVPPPGFQTEVLLLAPKTPNLSALPSDIVLVPGVMPLSQNQFQKASRELMELIVLAKSGR